jgi:hypothetical protein
LLGLFRSHAKTGSEAVKYATPYFDVTLTLHPTVLPESVAITE